MNRVVLIMDKGFAVEVDIEYSGRYYRCIQESVVTPNELEDYWIGFTAKDKKEFDINIYKLDDNILKAALYPVENRMTDTQRGTDIPLEIL